MSSRLRDLTEFTEAEGRDDTHQCMNNRTLFTESLQLGAAFWFAQYSYCTRSRYTNTLAFVRASSIEAHGTGTRQGGVELRCWLYGTLFIVGFAQPWAIGHRSNLHPCPSIPCIHPSHTSQCASSLTLDTTLQ